MPSKGEIYSVEVFYKKTSGPSKARPVLIINDISIGEYTIVELTSISPKEPPGYYDNFKEKIEKWNKYGLDEESYVKCKNIHNIKAIRFIKYIGTIDSDEFERIINRIIEVNQP